MGAELVLTVRRALADGQNHRRHRRYRDERNTVAPADSQRLLRRVQLVQRIVLATCQAKPSTDRQIRESCLRRWVEQEEIAVARDAVCDAVDLSVVRLQ